MNNRYSIHDQLNNGRQRKSVSTLDDLEATIGGIEARLDRMRGRADAGSATSSEDIADRMRRLSGEISGMGRQGHAPRPIQERTFNERDVNRISREVERARIEEQQHGQMASVMNELQQLRGEMRRLSVKPQDDWGTALRREIDSLKQGIGALAREDTLRSVESRWAQAAKPPVVDFSNDPVIESLLDRIDSVQNAVNGLPQSLSITSLEEKIRVLASAIDQMSRRQPEINPEQLLQIEDRLDEISRAIVASSVSVQAVGNDKIAFERIEARLGVLNERIDELMSAEPGRDVQDRISKIAEQLDVLASKAGAPTDQMVRMASQMEIIADKLSQLDARDHEADTVARSMEERLQEIAQRLEHSQMENGRESRSILSELELRLEEMAARMPSSYPVQTDNSEQILAAVEERFADLSRQLHSYQPDNSIDPVFAQSMENRFAEITNRLNQSVAAIPGSNPEAIARLEQQVGKLTQQLSAPRSDFQLLETLAPRLDSIEKNLAGNHEALLSMARQAAEDVLRNSSVTGGGADSDAVYQLANDLKQLDALARKSDDRNTKTFEAIHDTLLKIVDRLSSLETAKREFNEVPFRAEDFNQVSNEAGMRGAAQRQSTPPAKLDLGVAAPALDSVAFGDNDGFEDFEPVPVRSPAEAALAAANAARETGVASALDATSAKPKGGLLSGLSKALRRDDKKVQGELPGSSLPKAEPMLETFASGAQPVAESDPSQGAPDLNTIMKRVRDERRGRADGKSDDNAKSDFLAAARRAAQAAAADAEILKNKNSGAAKSNKLGLADILQRQRKPILMGALAVMLALTGLQLGKAFFGGSDSTVTSDAAPAASIEPAPKLEESSQAPALILPSNATDSASDSVNPVGTPTEEKVRVAASNEPTAEPGSLETPKETSTSLAAAEDAPTETAKAETAVEPTPATPSATTASASAADAIPADVGPIALREAAGAGNAKALFEIGARYSEGRGVNKDAKLAVDWYQKAADAGFAPAQFRLGSLYEKGIGVERSAEKAKTLYQLAAEQGNASAMHNLAVLFAMGAAGPADNDSAARWFTKAAEFGVKDSQYNLGILAAKGLGVPQSLEESYKWFALAAKSGDKDAASKRDEIANVMRPEQLQKARATADLWKAKPLDAESNSVETPAAWNADSGATASTNSADMVKAIRNIQIILNQNGYDAGSPDGKIGGKTKKAIAAYQKANGMTPTGEVDDALVKSLLKKVKS